MIWFLHNVGLFLYGVDLLKLKPSTKVDGYELYLDAGPHIN